MFTIYAIYNRKHNKIYIGQTMDIKNRLEEHNDRGNTKHTYTKRFDGKWEIIYQENTDTRLTALKREKQLKSYRGRQFIKSNIPL